MTAQAAPRLIADYETLRTFLSDPHSSHSNPTLRLNAWRLLKLQRGQQINHLRLTRDQRLAGLHGRLAQLQARGRLS